jgi:hypothetical protein
MNFTDMNSDKMEALGLFSIDEVGVAEKAISSSGVQDCLF